MIFIRTPLLKYCILKNIDNWHIINAFLGVVFELYGLCRIVESRKSRLEARAMDEAHLTQQRLEVARCFKRFGASFDMAKSREITKQQWSLVGYLLDGKVFRFIYWNFFKWCSELWTNIFESRPAKGVDDLRGRLDEDKLLWILAILGWNHQPYYCLLSSFPVGLFQVRTVSFREGNSSHVQEKLEDSPTREQGWKIQLLLYINHPKSNMTLENPPCMKMYFLLNMGLFQAGKR